MKEVRTRFGLTLHPDTDPEDAAFLELMKTIPDPSKFLVRLALGSGGPATRADLEEAVQRILAGAQPVIQIQEQEPKVKKAAIDLMKNWT